MWGVSNQGNVAIVIGSAKGVGNGIVRRLAKDGLGT